MDRRSLRRGSVVARVSWLARLTDEAADLVDSLDVVRAKEIIEHLVDVKPFMVEVYRVLKPGGLFLSRTPTPMSILYPVGNFYDDYTHVRPLSRLGLEHLLNDANFQIVFIRGYTAGRNRAERLLGGVLGRVFPHAWFALARKPA